MCSWKEFSLNEEVGKVHLCDKSRGIEKAEPSNKGTKEKVMAQTRTLVDNVYYCNARIRTFKQERRKSGNAEAERKAVMQIRMEEARC